MAEWRGTLKELLGGSRRLGLAFTVKNDNATLAIDDPYGRVTPALRSLLLEHRHALIELINKETDEQRITE